MPVAFVGESGAVIQYVAMLAALGIVGSIVLAYAAHCFLVVVQDTAAGIDAVVWPRDSLAEWLGGATLMGWLVLVWIAPLGMLLRTLKPAFVTETPGLAVLLAGVVLGVFFPIGVLSALSGRSGWRFFRLRLLSGLARIA